MKQLFYLFLLVVLFGCKDIFKDTSHYSMQLTQSKEYPVYLDMSEIGNIQVKANSPLVAPFKILSNDKYYFVGEMLKGVHVYERKALGVSYLCFIECRFIKDFELVDNRLFCNNLVDMVVVDVSNPTNINVLHRQKNYFNRFTSFKNDWNLPYTEGKGIIIGTESQELTGVVTDKQPELNFSELDAIYGNLTTKIIPDAWISNNLKNDKPYIGMIKMGTDEIYTYGSYNSWTISTYRSGTFSVREEDLWATPRGKYAPPYYYSDSYPEKMFFQDSLIFILGAGYSNMGYSDCITYNESYPLTYHLYFPYFRPVDITYMPTMQAYFVLSGQSVWVAFKSNDSVYMKRYFDYKIPTEATSIFRIGTNIITLGDELKVYSPSENELKLVKNYPGISGTCYLKAGDILAVANTKGLYLYHISDPENIQLIP
jgi:hypothetical protein